MTTNLPEPTGYRILCSVPKAEQQTAGGIILPDEAIRTDELVSTVLHVVKLGPEAYADTKRFPKGPWCKEGDYVVCRPHAGSRLLIGDQEYRIINDDTVEGVVDSPRGIKRG